MFKAPRIPTGTQPVLYEDRFRRIELTISFKRITCLACRFEAIYKLQVKQLRRRQEIRVEEGEEIRPDHIQIWETIPRFAEIPETVKCKRCKEVLTPDILCIY